MCRIKPHLTFREQVERLKAHGCAVRDEGFCEAFFSHVNYYRFSAYFLPAKNEAGDYAPGTDFETAYNIYEFDRKLRGLLFQALGVLEIQLRTTIAYYHSLEYGPLGYTDAANFSGRKATVGKLHIDVNKLVEQNSNLLFVEHHIENYGGQFPLWVIIELFTFGMLSHFYRDLKTADKKVVAKALGGVNHKDAQGWLRCCTDLRNICAHQGRLYYRQFSAIPGDLGLTEKTGRTLWAAVLALRALFPSKEKWNGETLPALENVFKEYADFIDLSAIGFPEDWAAVLKKE